MPSVIAPTTGHTKLALYNGALRAGYGLLRFKMTRDNMLEEEQARERRAELLRYSRMLEAEKNAPMFAALRGEGMIRTASAIGKSVAQRIQKLAAVSSFKMPIVSSPGEKTAAGLKLPIPKIPSIAPKLNLKMPSGSSSSFHMPTLGAPGATSTSAFAGVSSGPKIGMVSSPTGAVPKALTTKPMGINHNEAGPVPSNATTTGSQSISGKPPETPAVTPSGTVAAPAGPPGPMDRISKFWDRTGMSRGRWQYKAPLLAAGALGAYGLYRGGKSLLNRAGQEGADPTYGTVDATVGASGNQMYQPAKSVNEWGTPV